MKKRSQRRLISCFEKNKIRWGLACYRWKEGISWNDYHLEIRHVLGLKLNDKRISEGKDPKRFVVENIQPNEQKLILYKRFIEKVASEYLAPKIQEDYVSIMSDYLFGFIGMHRIGKDDIGNIVEYLSTLEKTVYANISSDSSLGLRFVNFICFRKIAASPKIFIYRFSISIGAVPDNFFRQKKSDEEKNAHEEKGLIRKFLAQITSSRELDEYPISHLNIGFLVPVSKLHYCGFDIGYRYIANRIFLRAQFRPNGAQGVVPLKDSIDFSACMTLSSFGEETREYHAFDAPSIQERVERMGSFML